MQIMPVMESDGVGVEQPPHLSRRNDYTFGQFWRSYRGAPLLHVRLGYWHELGAWPVPGSMFRWSGRLNEAWYWLKCRVWHQYNVVRVRTEPPTWRDSADFVLPLLMQMLTNFVEKERPFEHFDTSFHYDGWWSIRDIYEWWHIRRPERVKRQGESLRAWSRNRRTTDGDRLFAEHRRLEADGEAEDEAMMIRLIKLRGHLWT